MFEFLSGVLRLGKGKGLPQEEKVTKARPFTWIVVFDIGEGL